MHPISKFTAEEIAENMDFDTMNKVLEIILTNNLNENEVEMFRRWRGDDGMNLTYGLVLNGVAENLTQRGYGEIAA